MLFRLSATVLFGLASRAAGGSSGTDVLGGCGVVRSWSPVLASDAEIPLDLIGLASLLLVGSFPTNRHSRCPFAGRSRPSPWTAVLRAVLSHGHLALHHVSLLYLVVAGRGFEPLTFGL